MEAIKVETCPMVLPPPSYNEAIGADQNDENAQIEGKETPVEVRRGILHNKARRHPRRLCALLSAFVLLVVYAGIMAIAWRIHTHKPLEERLLAAAQDGDLDRVSHLLAEGADVNARLLAFYGRSALHLAVEGRDLEMVRLLLAKGANATIRSSGVEWKAPLHLAVTSGCKVDIVTALLEAGATPEDKDSSGRQALGNSMPNACYEALWARSREKKRRDELNACLKPTFELLQQLLEETKKNGGKATEKAEQIRSQMMSNILSNFKC